MEFSRLECWSGKPKHTGVRNLSLLQWIFPTQKSNWGLLHCGQILYQLSSQGSSVKHKYIGPYTSEHGLLERAPGFES